MRIKISFFTLMVAGLLSICQAGSAVSQENTGEKAVNVALIGGEVEYDQIQKGHQLQSLINQKSFVEEAESEQESSSFIHEYLRNKRKTVQMQVRLEKRQYFHLETRNSVNDLSYGKAFRALEWILKYNQDHKPANQVHVAYIGMSSILVHTSEKHDLLHRAVRAVVKSGTTIIVPAGDGSRTVRGEEPVIPAAYPETITVATQHREEEGIRRLPESSNFGPAVDLAHPITNDEMGERNPLDSSFAALGTVQYAAHYIHDAMNDSDNPTVPTPRQVRWELVEKQSRAVTVRHLGEKKQFREPDITDYIGDRVPEDYTIFPENSHSVALQTIKEKKNPTADRTEKKLEQAFEEAKTETDRELSEEMKREMDRAADRVEQSLERAMENAKKETDRELEKRSEDPLDRAADEAARETDQELGKQS